MADRGPHCNTPRLKDKFFFCTILCRRLIPLFINHLFPMKAVIMSGGFGTRLRPLTCNIPKPMVPMMNKPMMQHIVSLLKKHGSTDIVSTLFYQPESITSFFGDGSLFGITMQYRKAEADYGTAGSVRNAADFLDERFI